MATPEHGQAVGVKAWHSSESPLLAVLRLVLERAARQARQHDLWYSLPFIGAVLALSLAPLLGHDGWPLNHDLLFWKYRLLVYVEHVRRFDLLPVWSESAAQGLGAPVPVLYHKLFYLPATLLYLVAGSVKVALLGTLAGFSLVGLLGLRSLFRFIGVEPRAALVAGAVLLFCNYTYTDWVVRGAFAEHAAMMLLPWLFRWLFGVLQLEAAPRLMRSGVVLFPLLYLAHTTLFYFAGVPVLAAVLWRLLRGGDHEQFLRALGAMLAAFALVSLPIVICQLVLVPHLNFREGIAVFAPRYYFSSLAQHITGGDYVWGRTWEGYSVQFDMPLVVVAGLALVWVTKEWMVARAEGGRSSAEASEFSPWLRGYVACWCCVLYFAFLLTPWSNAAYAHVPGFWTLQFPWRLLSFISVLIVALAAMPLLRFARLGASSAATPAAWMLLGVTYVASPWLHEIEYAWTPGAQLEAPLEPLARLHMGASEYHPRVPGMSGYTLINYLSSLSPAPDALSWSSASYKVERVDVPEFEKGTRTYRIAASQASEVVLPIAYSPFIRVESLVGGQRNRLRTFKQSTDPRVHVAVPAGEVELEIRFPTLLSLYADLISGAASRTPANT